MAKFNTLKVSDVRRETADCVSIAFDIPASLKADYTYIQGQYLTLKLKVKGEEIRRSYSLCSSPLADAEWRIAVKKVKDGRGSGFINGEVKVGDVMEVMTPMGNFHTALSPTAKKQYVLFAGGSGITPMLSIIKTVLKAEPGASLQLFYGNRDETSTIFKSSLDQLAGQSAGRFNVFYILENPTAPSEELYKGLLSKDKVKALLAKHTKLEGDYEVFICGPGPMMDNVKSALQELKTDEKRVHIEYFTAVLEAVNKAEAESAPGNDLVSQVTVIMDGQKTSFELATGGQAILDQALDAGVDVPYACKGAVCCTCRAKLLEGKVKMDNNYALTDNEVKEGYILTCQSHPLTSKVVVDYDV
ncbi:MAG TPA: 2Fe-2S iron-sulfur cluster-binding protein [Bacteroidia bacterium]|jgi:ring-1,2-phenylacetyl-CoA epoxidase subunit PaaE|nr:2Fe-2S iron-sulfur cluster-binding protein [Bacteroidia bacterium]